VYSLADLPQRGSMEDVALQSSWPEFDEIFRFYPGQFVVVTGRAGHGKSTFVLNMLVRLSYQLGLTSFLYVPENEQSLRAKLRLLCPQGDADFEYLIRSKFFVQTSVREYDGPPHTMPWILNGAAQMLERNTKIELVLIDPWNELDRLRPRDMLLTDYIGECIMQIKDFCRALGVIVIVIAHPTKAVNENGGRIARLDDIEGSMNWYNKCDNGLIVVREDSNHAKVISAKVREMGAGRLGACHFMVDPNTGIFTPQYGATTL
jgi:replicative DNA helicase